MTFTQWLTTMPHRGPIRDFAEDVKRDPKFPPDATQMEYSRYLIECDACAQAQHALKRAWRAWKKAESKARA